MGAFAKAIDEPMLAQINCSLSTKDTERHLRVREWSNEKLMRHIHDILDNAQRTRYILNSTNNE